MKLNNLHKLSKFSSYPFIKCNLAEFTFQTHIKNGFKYSYNNLPNDSDKTRQRRYANYEVIIANRNSIHINHTGKTTFSQNVNDSRKNERIFELIENPYNEFILAYIKLVSQILSAHNPIKNITVDVHQVRQLCYPGIDSHNSEEGIHQDGADFVVPALIIDRHNISGGISSVYNNNKELLYRELLKENDFILQDDKDLFHYVTPIKYYESDGFEDYGYRDLLGLDIIIK